jgi:hypothetical protein
MEHQEQQGTTEKRQSTRALQQRIQPKRDISSIASWTAVNRDISYLRNEAKTNIKNTLMSGCQKSMRNVLWD